MSTPTIREAVRRVLDHMSPGEYLTLSEINQLRIRQMGVHQPVHVTHGMAATSLAVRFYVEGDLDESHMLNLSDHGKILGVQCNYSDNHMTWEENQVNER